MDQELEQRVNEIVRTTGVTFQEALQQVQNEIGQEEAEGVLEEGEKKNSNSSDGTFTFIDQVNFPVAPTESELNNMSLADRIFAIDRYKKDFDVANTLLTGYNASVQEQFQKLQELVKKEKSAENRAQIYDTFIQETGVDLSEEFSTLEGTIQENIEKNERIQSGLDPLFDTAVIENNFEPVRDYLKSNGVSDEYIQGVEEQWKSRSTDYSLQRGGVEHAAEMQQLVYSSDELEQKLREYEVKNPGSYLEGTIDEIVSGFDRYKQGLGNDFLFEVFESRTELADEIKDLKENGYSAIDPDLSAINEGLAKDIYNARLANAQANYDEIVKRENKMRDLVAANPLAREALAFITMSSSRYFSSLSEEMRERVTNKELNMYEAAWEESEEYKIATERLDEVILDRDGTPYLEQEKRREERFEKDKAEFIKAEKKKIADENLKNLKMITAGMEDKAEIQALERAIYEISGNAIDIEEEGGYVGDTRLIDSFGGVGWLAYASNQVTDFIAAGIGELPAMAFRGIQYARGSFDETVAMNQAQTMLDNGLLSQEEYEERLELIEQRRDVRDDSIELFLNPDFLEDVRERSIAMEDGIMDSFRAGNYGAGVLQSLEMASEALPLTLATMVVSTVASPAAGLAFASSIAAGMEYEAVRKEEWYNNMSDAQKSAYITGIGLIEGGSEVIGGFATSRLVKGVGKRLINESRDAYLKRFTKNTLVNYSSDAFTEMSVEYGGAGLKLGFGGVGIDWRNLNDAAIESGIVSLFMSGGVQLGGATINAGGSVVRDGLQRFDAGQSLLSSFDSAFNANMNPDQLIFEKDLQQRVTNILQTTKPGSQVRAQMLEQLMEDSSVGAQIKMDSFEFNEYLRQSNPVAAQQLSQNTTKLAKLMKTLQSSTDATEIKQLRSEISSLVAENQSIESSAMAGFAVNSVDVANASIGKLQNRASLFLRQATRLENQGNLDGAKSLRQRAERIQSQIETITLNRDVTKGLQDGTIISSKDRNAAELSDKLSAMNVDAVVVDEALSEEMKAKGYVEVVYDSQDGQGKLMMKAIEGGTLKPELTQGLSLQDAVSNYTLARLDRQGSLDQVELERIIVEKQLTGNALSEVEQRLLDNMSEDSKQRIDDRIERVRNRKANDLRQANRIERDLAEPEANKSLREKLGRALGQKVSLVSEDEIFRQAYKRAKTAQERASIKEQYLSGATEIGGAYLRSRTDVNTGEIFISDTATQKDIIEEFAHATIHSKLNTFDRASQQLLKGLEDIASRDPQMLADLEAKKNHYMSSFNMSPSQIREEMYVEIFATYVANEISLRSETKTAVGRWIDSISKGFIDGGGETGKVMRKLAESLREDVIGTSDVAVNFNEIFAIPEAEVSAINDIEQNVLDAANLSSRSSRPSFLDNKAVTFNIMSTSRYTGLSNVVDVQTKTFNDYFHFVNWYRKMTGNGKYYRIGKMSYVNNDGVTKELRPPKPLLDKTTGQPVEMEAALKSYDQRAIDFNKRQIAKKEARHQRLVQANVALGMIRDQIHDTIEKEMARRSGFGDWGGGNTTNLLKELMEDFTPDGVVNESELDAFGRPKVEKQIGSPEYHEELFHRANEWMSENFPGESILFSSSAPRRSFTALFNASNGLTSKQKRSNIDKVMNVIGKKVLGFNSPILQELKSYVDNLNEGVIGGSVPRPLVNALLSATDAHYLSEAYKASPNPITREQLIDMYTKKLVAFDRMYDNRGRDFYKNTNVQLEKIIEAVGRKPVPDGKGGIELTDNAELAQLAKRHRPLLIGLLGVTSNGSKAKVNLAEATALYSVILNELQDELNAERKKDPAFAGSKKEKKWLREFSGGPRFRARLEQIANEFVFTTTSITPTRGAVISNAAAHLINIYNFNHPPHLKNKLSQPGQESRSTVLSQDSTKRGGFGPKIGAFIINMLGDKTVLTQDLHVTESMDRMFRPNQSASVDIPALHKFMMEEMELTEADILKIEQENDWIAFEQEGPEGLQKIYNVKKVISWLKNTGATRIGGVCNKPKKGSKEFKRGAQVIRRYIEDNFVPRRVPRPSERVENAEIVAEVLERLKKIKGYKRATIADVGQMIFLENHVAQNAFGASNRTYEDFYGEAAEGALNEWEAGLIASADQVGFTPKYGYLQKFDPLDATDPSTVIDLLEAQERGEELTESQEALLEFSTMYPETFAMMTRMSSMEFKEGHDPVFFSSKKVFPAGNHPQSRSYEVASLFQGRQVSSVSNIRFGKTKMDLNKLLEGRASEINMKAKVASFGPAEQFEDLADGIIVMRNPLHSESFVDAYGNKLKFAEKGFASGDMMVVSGKVRFEPPDIRPMRDDVRIEDPEHFVAYQNFVSIIKQRNQSLQNASSDLFESAYKAMTPKERARFANLTVDEHGTVIKGRKLRGTSKRVANSSEFGRFKAEIINNPNNYIDQQKISEQKKLLEEMSPQELVSLMRGDALNNLATRNDDVGVLAGIELINRMQADGNDIGIVSVLDQLAAVGTTAGRVLRHMAELKTSSPQGMASVIIKKAESQGKILSEAQKKEILDATKEYMRAYRMVEDFMERGIAGEDVENLFKRAQEDLSNAERDLDTLANKYVEKSWAEIGQQLVQGNLLTMMSQARNVVYNVANIIPKTVVDILSMPTSKAFELLGLHKEQRKLSLAAYLYAMRKFGAGTVEAIEQVITGREKDMSEWRMSRGFMPIRSLMHAMSTDLPEGQTMRDEFNQRAKLLVQGTFGIPAEAMFRLLSLGDVPFRRFAEGLELYNIGRGKGLEGDALAQFLKFPDKDSAEQGATEGRKLTFQEPMGLARGSMWIIDNISRGMGQAFKNVKGFNGEGFFKFLIRLNVPYVSTIANFTEETLVYASPVFGGGKMAIQMGNGEYTEASKTLTKVMVGQAVSTTALYLISQGLLSGSVDWEDDEKTNLMYDTFPPNSINVSGLRRLLNGEDPSPQAGDEFRSYQTLGVFGTIMGAYAHSTTPEAAKEMAEQPFSGNNALKKLFGFDNVSVVAYMMDQSFLQGLNGITSVIASTSDPDDFERAFFRYVETISKAFSSMFLPNVLSGVDQATREHLPDKRDKDLADRIKNHVRERTFNTGGLPVKVNWKGERIEQAPVGGNQFAYYMFDATKKREASQDEVSLNILNLYLDTGVLTKAVGTPYYASSVYKKLRPPSVKRGKAKKAYAALGTAYQFIENPQEDFFVRLTAEEINNALEMTNTLRYNDIQSFMQTEDYQGMTNNEKIEALDDINDRYKSLLSYNPDGSFMEHSKYILGIMERRYLEQYGQD